MDKILPRVNGILPRVNGILPRVNGILPRDPNKIWTRILWIAGTILVIAILYNRINLDKYHEGFVQTERFVTKSNNDIYDEFYVELYDKIHLPELQINFIIEKVINMTEPSKEKSVFLDIGSGTGSLTNELKKKGYTIYGIDKSQSMVDYCSEKYPELPIKCGDIMTPMMYDRNTFSHVLCTNMSIYHFQDKKAFFRNCYFIMKPNSYMILHLVNWDKFDPIVQSGKPEGIGSAQQYADMRITNTSIDFVDFKYKATYDLSKSTNKAKISNKGQSEEICFVETMTDNLTNNVRQNNLILNVEKIDDILKIAIANGYTVKGQVNMKECIWDEYQYIFVLERML